MNLTHGVIKSLGVNFNAAFQKAFVETKLQYPEVATVISSATASEEYGWLNSFPKMREWIGDRVINKLSASGYTVKNKDFEMTVAVGRNEIEDDQIGIYGVIFQQMGASAAKNPEDEVFRLLKGGFSNKCYDGKNFFATDHKVGKNTVSNKGTAKLSQESFLAARSAMMSITNDSGVSLGIVPTTLVVPPALEGTAKLILEAEQINGTSNIARGLAKILVVPELAGSDNAWYLLATSMPLKPLVWQERKKVAFRSFTEDSSEHVFNFKEFVYGCDSRGSAGYAFWQMAYGSDGTATASE